MRAARAAFVGANLLQSAFTGFCTAAAIFRKLGPDDGKASCTGPMIMPAFRKLVFLSLLATTDPALAAEMMLTPVEVTETKALFGQIESRFCCACPQHDRRYGHRARQFRRRHG